MLWLRPFGRRLQRTDFRLTDSQSALNRRDAFNSPCPASGLDMPGNGKQPATHRELNWTDARTHARTNNEPSKKRKDKSDEGEVNEDTDTAFKQAAHASLQSSNKRLAASSSKCPALECEESDGEPYDKDELRAPSQSCHSDEWSNSEESQEEEEMLIIDDDISGKVEMVAAVAAAEEAETVTNAVGTAEREFWRRCPRPASRRRILAWSRRPRVPQVGARGPLTTEARSSLCWAVLGLSS